MLYQDEADRRNASAERRFPQPGTHIHFIDPASASKTVRHVGYQEDVIAMGHLFVRGELYNERVINWPALGRLPAGFEILHHRQFGEDRRSSGT